MLISGGINFVNGGVSLQPDKPPDPESVGLWVWGRNNYGNLGDGTGTSTSSPIQTISGGTNWISIGAGYLTGFGIKTDGTLWGWGTQGAGTSGLGDNTVISRYSPVQTIAGGTTWKQVDASTFTGATATIKTDGTLWVWGRNSTGELGDNTRIDRSSPVQTVAGGTIWKQVSVGRQHMVAVKTDGTLWTWGRNAYSQLGDGTNIDRSSPVQTVAGGSTWGEASARHSHQCAAIKTDGTLWTWGRNDNGALGDNTRIHRSSPVQTVSGGSNWQTVTCGYSVVSSIKTDGTLWTWGYNAQGQLGDNTVIAKSSPVQTITGGNDWAKISVGTRHAAAIKTNGTLWLWGQNTAGALGDNTTISKSSPVQTIAGGTNWSNVSAGGYFTMTIRAN